jgi:hypothetical protein
MTTEQKPAVNNGNRVEIAVRKPDHTYQVGAAIFANVRKPVSFGAPGFSADTMTVERFPEGVTVTFQGEEWRDGGFTLSLENARLLLAALSDAVLQDY